MAMRITLIKNLPHCAAGFFIARLTLKRDDVHGLEPFWALLDGKLNLLAFAQTAVSICLDRRVMDEYVRPVFLSKETIALVPIEPFDRSDDTFRHCIASLGQEKIGLMHFLVPSEQSKKTGQALCLRPFCFLTSNEN
jgi:hypothetical protein